MTRIEQMIADLHGKGQSVILIRYISVIRVLIRIILAYLNLNPDISARLWRKAEGMDPVKP